MSTAIAESRLRRVRMFLRRRRTESAAGPAPRRPSDGAARDDAAAAALTALVARSVRPAAPARVLLAAADERIREHASALLRARGCSVLVDNGGDLRVQAIRRQVDVVVVDATGSSARAGRAAARLRSLRPAVGLVAISTDPCDHLFALPIVPQWSATDGLYLRIELARQEASNV